VGARTKASVAVAATSVTSPTTTLAWEVVLVDRALLELVKQTLRASSTSEAIDRALTLAAREAEFRDGRLAPLGDLANSDGGVGNYPLQ
jgi:hypothetical protein